MSGPPPAVRLCVAAAAFAVQCWGLYAPHVSGPDTGLPVDKVAHFAIFAAVTAAALWAGLPTWLVVAVMTSQAVLSEVVQGLLLPDRAGDWADLFADALGIAAGVLLLQLRGRSHT